MWWDRVRSSEVSKVQIGATIPHRMRLGRARIIKACVERRNIWLLDYPVTGDHIVAQRIHCMVFYAVFSWNVGVLPLVWIAIAHQATVYSGCTFWIAAGPTLLGECPGDEEASSAGMVLKPAPSSLDAVGYVPLHWAAWVLHVTREHTGSAKGVLIHPEAAKPALAISSPPSRIAVTL